MLDPCCEVVTSLVEWIQHTAVEGDGVVVMWQHDIANPPLHISSVPWSDLWKDNFDFGRWTIVLYWEHTSASVPEQPNPPDLEDVTMPEYGDPDVPMPDQPKDDPPGPPTDRPPRPGTDGSVPRERSRSRDRDPPETLHTT